MKMKPGLFILFLAAGALARPELTVKQGKLIGKYEKTISGRRISSFLGIPYAKPPIAKLRFHEPVAAGNWMGVLNATRFSADCLQYSPTGVRGDEDCLYLNVFVPEEVDKNKRLDVLVYIHGGAFMYLSGSENGPKYLLDHDIILVTLNYRLGIFGFLSTEDLALPGNNGLKDQQMALKWVKDNIEVFGGDPEKITIAGMSAGGSSVHYQILNSANKGIFKRAIMLSGSAFCHWSQVENSRQKAERIADEMGCLNHDSEKMVECLRQRPGHHIVELSKLFMGWRYNPFTPFGPVIEPPHPKAFIDKTPSYLIKNKMIMDIPLMVSLTADEGLYPGAEILANPDLMQYLDENWGQVIPHLLDFNYTVRDKEEAGRLIREEYFGKDSIQENKKALVEMISDRVFNLPVSLAAIYHAKYLSSDVYTMKFSHIGKTGLQDEYNLSRSVYSGASHADDLSYVLRADYMAFDDDPDALKMSKYMLEIWSAFISRGKLPEKWQPLNKQLPNYSYFDIRGSDRAQNDFVVESNFARKDFWKSIDFKEDPEEEYKTSREEL